MYGVLDQCTLSLFTLYFNFWNTFKSIQLNVLSHHLNGSLDPVYYVSILYLSEASKNISEDIWLFSDWIQQPSQDNTQN